MKILAVVGSLRSASFSRKLALAAGELAPDGTTVDLVDGRDLPLYDQDLDGEEKPAAVQTLLDQVSAADALFFVTPEFNYGIPGPLKNLIDWASRPAFSSPLKDTPAMVVALSPAPAGGARVHLQLSSVLSGTLTPFFLAPSFTVGGVHEKFDETGALTDEITRRRLEKNLAAFIAWASKISA